MTPPSGTTSPDPPDPTPADPPPSSLQDRFRGALLGTLLGDALGMPVEGWSPSRIRARFGEMGEMHEGRLPRGSFTDDTQMAAALARALSESPRQVDPDPAVLARHFARAFEPHRGYGTNTRKLLEAIREGTPWEEAVERFRFPGGSFANGSAMRVAPVALAAFPDPGRAMRWTDLQSAATGHDHSEARFGARLQAAGVLLCLRRDTVEDTNRRADHPAGTDPGPGNGTSAPPHPPGPAQILSAASTDWDEEIPRGFLDKLEWIDLHPGEPGERVASTLGNGVRAVESVPAALWAFLSAPDDPGQALTTAVSMGGDTDTIGAMAGALAGAWKGASHLPGRWLETVEGGPQGREGLMTLADTLFRRLQG